MSNGAEIRYIRCYKCMSLLELQGTFGILAPNPISIKCPVCSTVNQLENSGSKYYKISNIIEQRPLGSELPISVHTEEIIQPEAPTNIFSGILTGLKNIGIWVVLVLVLILIIKWRK